MMMRAPREVCEIKMMLPIIKFQSIDFLFLLRTGGGKRKKQMDGGEEEVGFGQRPL